MPKVGLFIPAAMRSKASISAHCPYKWTGKIARTLSGRRFRNHRSTGAVSRFSVSGSTSIRTGVAPARTMALAEAKKLNAAVMTESPGRTPAATSASQSASVPDAQPTARGRSGQRRDFALHCLHLRPQNEALRIAHPRNGGKNFLANARVVAVQIE
ncbi:MAG: hypothetical protein WCC22_20310 [Terriglobales bacterium]